MTKVHLKCPTCLEEHTLHELRGDERPCEACSKKARRFTYFDRGRDVIFSWCEDIECQWEVADLLGMDRHRLSWCSCTKEEVPEFSAADMAEAIHTKPGESLMDTVREARQKEQS